MGKIMADRMVFFVGADDSPAMRRRAIEAQLKGAFILQHTNCARCLLDVFQPRAVRVKGGALHICIPKVVGYCLDSGVRVTVDLRECGESKNPDAREIALRRSLFKAGMGRDLSSIPRLRVLPRVNLPRRERVSPARRGTLRSFPRMKGLAGGRFGGL
jgi:hypothetical protein